MNAHPSLSRIATEYEPVLVTADASKVSGADFARSLGLRIRSKEQIAAEWDASVERYVGLILSGCDLSEYGNPAVREAKARIALREGDAGVVSDPLRRSA